MVWVAIDRGLRLSDKRSLPLSAKQRSSWLAARDSIYGTSLRSGTVSSLNLAADVHPGSCRGGHGQGLEQGARVLPPELRGPGYRRLGRPHYASREPSALQSSATRTDASRPSPLLLSVLLHQRLRPSLPQDARPHPVPAREGRPAAEQRRSLRITTRPSQCFC
jgi:hypothetical protein